MEVKLKMKQNTENLIEIMLFVLILISSILMFRGHEDFVVVPAMYLIFVYVKRVNNINKKHQLK